MSGTLDPRRQQLAADSYRPLYHFLAPANFMGDPNGAFFWKGKYHLFYQYNPHGAFDSSRLMHWGHAVSEDLVHWLDLPIALAPDPAGCDRAGCWSGGAFDNDGVPTLIYYGHPGGNCLAFSDDEMIHWEKHRANPVIPHPPEGREEWKPFDPCLWREGDEFYALSGGKLEGLGDTAFLFRSNNLVDWKYVHPLYANPLDAKPESDCAVPDFFPLGDKHMLLFASHERGAQYYIGTYAGHKFHPEHHGRLNYGDFTLSSGHALAPLSLADGCGRRIAFTWISEGRSEAVQRASGWAGIMSLPQVFSLAADNTLHIEPAAELASLRRAHGRLAKIKIPAGAPVIAAGIEGDCFELALELDPGSAQVCGIALRCAPDGSEQTTIYHDAGAACLALDAESSSTSATVVGRGVQRAPLALGAGENLQLRIFLDRSVIEVFANNRRVLTKRIYPARPDSLGVYLFARGGTALLQALDAWKMAPIWPLAHG